ncbi:MAG: hypothetical protein IH955_01965 [Chloroflexi bacterium]|nr:hypothetical protein [Chloroflexota bacterium]
MLNLGDGRYDVGAHASAGVEALERAVQAGRDDGVVGLLRAGGASDPWV